jgi:nucleotide-binding universal stress UspA family protein
MKNDRAYLEKIEGELTSRGFATRSHLAMGDPATELVRVAAAEHVDLIAMSTHGHRLLNDIIRGSTADRVRHNVSIPVLMIKAR